ncbi:unnamed protein product [Polarella glacialis]|uniref:Uncharacterized protein n=1 Tax=Polarella glacialis TaxID=89957 RepID=A0A813HEF7_POLGL|nr:unnamed protein product [Polarella glacialis]CAE8715641.1 unnamed protein product [Polarella glacialis]
MNVVRMSRALSLAALTVFDKIFEKNIRQFTGDVFTLIRPVTIVAHISSWTPTTSSICPGKGMLRGVPHIEATFDTVLNDTISKNNLIYTTNKKGLLSEVEIDHRVHKEEFTPRVNNHKEALGFKINKNRFMLKNMGRYLPHHESTTVACF